MFSCATRALHLRPISNRLLRDVRQFSESMFNRPSPPPLPAHEQREFEDLLRAASTPAADAATAEIRLQAGEGQHPDARKPPAADFVGEVNPRTGEEGGPKTEPLKHGDWSYGGRATDF